LEYIGCLLSFRAYINTAATPSAPQFPAQLDTIIDTTSTSSQVRVFDTA
jgi:hypothetical protein